MPNVVCLAMLLFLEHQYCFSLVQLYACNTCYIFPEKNSKVMSAAEPKGENAMENNAVSFIIKLKRSGA